MLDHNEILATTLATIHGELNASGSESSISSSSSSDDLEIDVKIRDLKVKELSAPSKSIKPPENEVSESGLTSVSDAESEASVESKDFDFIPTSSRKIFNSGLQVL
jgi:hypothetical protein